MLTLFPRIRPNPVAPPPAEPLEPVQELTALLDDPPIADDSAPFLSEARIAADSAAVSSPHSSEHQTSVVIDSAGRVAIPVDTELVLPLTHPIVRVADEERSTQPEAQQAFPESAAEDIESVTEPIPQAMSESAAKAPRAEPSGDEVIVSATQLEHEFPGFVVKVPDLTVAASNIFDEIEVVHAASSEGASSHTEEQQIAQATPAEPASVSINKLIGTTEAAQANGAAGEEVAATREIAEVNIVATPARELHTEESKAEAETQLATAAKESVADATIEMGDWQTEPEEAIERAENTEAAAIVAENEPVLIEAEQAVAAESAGTASEEETASASAGETSPEESAPASEAAGEQAAADSSAENMTASESIAAAPALPAIPAKPRRSKESFFLLERVPEPEAMDDSGEVEAYASATAQAHLDAIDDTFVAHAQLLVRGRERGRALDIGTGPGQIVLKLGAKLTRWKFVGVDRSAAMIGKAQESLTSAAEVAGRVEFRVADGNALEFPDNSFDLVICNSVLHHVADPQALFAEIARVVKPGGAILLRDLRRPARFEYASHIRRNGKHYAGEMKRLYVASVQAAYTEEELQKLVAASALRGVHVFTHGKTHIGFERKLAPVQKAANTPPRTGPIAQRREAKNSFSNAADSTAFTPAVTST